VADVVVDTDVASKLIKEQEPEWVRRALVGNRVWLTFVTVGELSKWAEIRSWGPHLRIRVDTWAHGKGVVPWDDSIAVRWGQLAGRAQLRGRPRPQNDTWVAACCVHHGIGLVTLNHRDFADFAEHDSLLLLGNPE
jgi:toxin FitB